MEKVATPNSKTIDAVGEFLHVPAEKCIKTLFVQADNELICVLLRGNSELNDVKLKRVHPCDSLEMADPEVIREKKHSIPLGVFASTKIHVCRCRKNNICT